MNYAPVWKRALAFYADLLAVSLPLCLVLIKAWAGIGQPAGEQDLISLLSPEAALFLWAVFAFLYFFVFEAVWGWTPGKLALGLRVEGQGGGPCGFRAALARNIIRVLDMQLCCLVGLLSMCFSTGRQRLGDRIAGTVVVAASGNRDD